MALGYGDVRDIYDTLKGAGVVTQGLPEWSEEMNRLSGTNLYDAGKHDNVIKQFSHALDKVLEESGLVDVGREFGRASGELVGTPEVGAQIGAGLPRSTINFAPLFVPGVGWGAAAARLGGTALLSGAETYTETDSPLAGLISGGTSAAFPSVARLGEGLVKNRVGSFLSGQLLAGGFGEASGAVQTLAQGETPEFHPVNTLLGLTLGQAPFAAIHLGTKVLGISPKVVEVANKVTQERTVRDEVAKVPPIATIPDAQTQDVVSFNVLRETEQRLSQIRGEQVKVQEDLTLSPEEKVNKVNALLVEESELQRQKEQVVGDTVLGDIIRPDTTRTQVLGKEVARNAAGTWRAIHVADVDENPPELRNKVVGYSTLHEPNPELTETYNLRYSLPPEQWLTPKTLEEWQARGRKSVDPNQPNLPVQPREPTREEMFGHIQQLNEAKVEVDGATTPGELQKTITKINEVKEQVGLPPTNDRSLRQKVATLDKSGLVDPNDLLKVATKVEAEDVKRQLSALEAGHVSALFGETGAAPRGFHLIEPRIPKDAGGDVETKPVSDIVTDVAYGAIQHREAVEATRGQDPAQVGKDREDFIDLVEHFGSTKVDPKVAAKFLNERFGTVGWDEKEYADFVARPYVEKWQDLLERGLSRIVSRSPQPSIFDTEKITTNQLLRGEESYVPVTQWGTDLVNQMGVNEGGVGMLRYLQQSQNPLIRALANDWAKFPESIQRITARIAKMDGYGYARNNQRREVDIALSHGLLYADNVERELIVAHELGHGLTLAELDNPAKESIVQGLDDLRLRIVEMLSKEMREVYDKAHGTDFLNRYVAGTTHFGELSNDFRTSEIVYGLLDTREFVSQGWSSPVFRNFMLELKAPKKVGWFNRFTNLVKELLGIGDKVQGSVFEEFLSRTDQLLQQGEYSAGFSNFAERFYKNLGFSDTLAQGQTQRALGLLMNGTYGLTKADVFASLDAPSQIRSGEFITARRKFLNMQSEKGEDFMLHGKVMDELGFAVEQRGTDDLLHAALNGEVSDINSALEILPTATTDYLFARLRDFRDVLASIKAAATEKNEGLINLAQPRQVRQVIGEAYKTVNSLLKVELLHEEGANIVRNLQSVAPDAFLDTVTNNIARAPQWIKDLVPERDRDKVGPLKWFLGTAAQISRSDPVTAEYFDKGYEMSKNAREMHRNITKVMGVDLSGDTKTMTSAGLDRAIKSVNTPKLLRAVDQWMYWNNEMARREHRGVTMLPDSHPEVAKVLANLTPKERSDVTDTVVKAGVMSRVGQQEELNKMSQVAITRAAKIAMVDRELNTQQAVDVAKTLFEAVDANRSDPAVAQQADAQIKLVQSKLSPEGFLDLLKFTQGEVQKLGLWRDYYEQNPNWATARRMERWLIEYKRGGKLVQDQGSSRKEVLKKAEGATIVKQPWDQYEGNEDTYAPPSLSEELFQRMQQIEMNQLNILKSRGVSPDTLEEIQRFGLTTQLAREQAANVGAVPGFQTPPRLLSKGADELPWLWNHISHMERMSNYWTRQLFRAQADLHLGDSALKDRPDLVSLMRDHRDAVLSPDPDVIRKLNKFTTTWYMGLNPASAMVNGFQTITTLVPELTNITGKPLDSYRRLTSSISEVVRRGISREWGDTETTKFMDLATKSGERDFSMWDEDSATQESVSTRWKQLMSKQKVQTMGQKLSSMFGNFTNTSLWMFKQVEKFNHDVALLSGFRLAREQGMSFDDAATEAFRLNRAVNYGGGKTNRPIGAFSGTGTFPRSVAMLATNMQGYNIGVMGQMARYLQKGFFRPTGLTPSEVYNSRKAGIQMLATQLSLAGTLGMPFVAGMLSLLDQAFPGLEANKHVREWVAELFHSDEENGHLLSDIALTGLPSTLGWDMQSRLSMGNLVPGVTEYNGFQPGQLMGPPVSLITNFVNGLSRVGQGEPQGAEAFVPPGLRKLTQLLIDDGKLRDYKNRPVIDPTFGEKAGIVLGFQPKRLSDFNAASRIAKQSEDVANRRMGQFHQKLAEDVLKGNFGSVRQNLLAQAQNDKSYNPADGVRAVARAAEELTFPRDLRREGSLKTSQGRTRLLDVLNVKPSSQVSETDRLSFRTQIEQRLGLPSRVSMSDAQTANLMDQLRQQYPEATRVELRQRVNQLIRRQRLHTLSVGETD